MRLVRRLAGSSLFALVLLGVGMFSLVLAPMIHFYVLPRVELMPLNEETTSVSSGPGTYFDANTVSVKGPVMMTLTTHVVGDVAKGKQTGYAVWDVSTRIDTPQTVRLTDPRQAYSWNLQHVVSQRHTGLLVNCCQANPPVDIDVSHLPFPFVYLQFPYGVAKTTYDFWNPELGKAFPVRFAGTTMLQGHEFYRFDGSIPATTIGTQQVPGPLIGLPNSSHLVSVNVTYREEGIKILVDPTTGAPVSTSEQPITTFRLPGSSQDRLTVLSGTFTTTPASEQAVLATAVSGGAQLRMIGTTLPVTMLWAGGVLVLAGVGLVVYAARRSRRAAP
jgi:hypothetical protein